MAEIETIPESKSHPAEAGKIDDRTDQQSVGEEVDFLNINTPIVITRMSGSLQRDLGRAQTPINIRASRVSQHRPAGSATLQVVRPGGSQSRMGLEGIKRSLIVIHGRVAGFIAADNLVMVHAIRCEPADGH